MPAGGRAAWAALAGGIALAAVLASVFGSPALDAALRWQPELAAAEPWRAWTAALVHLAPRHLWGNVAAALVVGAFGVVAALPRHAAVAWFAAWPLTHAALLLRPEIAFYGGLSGLLHAGTAVAAVQLAAAGRDPRQRAVGAVVIAGLAVKIALEAPWGAPLRDDAWLGVATVPLAHAAGALAGLGCALLAAALARRGRLASRPS